MEFTGENDQTQLEIQAIYSQEGEGVALKRSVPVTRDVDVWLANLAEEMQNTLRRLTEECFSVEVGEIELNKWPSQVCMFRTALFVYFITQPIPLPSTIYKLSS